MKGFLKFSRSRGVFSGSLAVFLAALLVSLSLCPGEKSVRDSVIRLHVIANSNSDEDQKVKLLVRDAILMCSGEALSGGDFGTALLKTKSAEALLGQVALRVLEENSFDYGAKAFFGIEEYPDREYDGKVFPAGRYYSLRVVLGEGKGENWWCVLFPPLCIGSSLIFKQDVKPGGEPAKEVKSVKFKFKIKLFEFLFG